MYSPSAAGFTYPLFGTIIDYNGKTLIKCNSLLNKMHILYLFCIAFIPIFAMVYFGGYTLYDSAFVLFSGALILMFCILAPLAYVIGALTQQSRLIKFLGTTIQATKVQRRDLGVLDAGAHSLIGASQRDMRNTPPTSLPSSSSR